MINRELKIGLLLAMGFVLLVSVVVGEYVTTSNSPEPANLASAGARVRESVKTPGTNVFDNPTVEVPAVVEPGELVATRDRLDLPPEPVTTRAPVVSAMLSATAPHLNAPMPERDPEPTQYFPAQPTLEDAARDAGEPIVALARPVSASPAPVVPASKPYVAVKGDSLAKMARLHLGSDTPSNRNAIAALNPELQSRPDRIVVGKTYLIPARDTLTAQVPVEAETQPVASTPVPASPSATTTYTVQAGDSLWKIASKVVGDVNKLDEIRALNKDALGGADRLKPGMTLVLPAKN
jgi:LysM repeat protein